MKNNRLIMLSILPLISILGCCSDRNANACHASNRSGVESDVIWRGNYPESGYTGDCKDENAMVTFVVTEWAAFVDTGGNNCHKYYYQRYAACDPCNGTTQTTGRVDDRYIWSVSDAGGCSANIDIRKSRITLRKR